MIDVMQKLYDIVTDDSLGYVNAQEVNFIRQEVGRLATAASMARLKCGLMEVTSVHDLKSGLFSTDKFPSIYHEAPYTDIHGVKIQDGMIVKVLEFDHMFDKTMDVQRGQNYVVSVAEDGDAYIQETSDRLKYMNVEVVC